MAKRTRREILAEPPPAPPAVNALPAEMVECTFTIQLVTPMFGGGVVAGHPDDRFPVRPTAIRGHLRFWWRVIRGGSLEDPALLRQRENEIWGSTEKPSPTLVEVVKMQLEEPRACARYLWNQQKGRNELIWSPPFGAPASDPDTEFTRPLPVTYCLFPFQGEGPADRKTPAAPPRKLPSTYTPGGSFGLRVVYPRDLGKEVQSALWGWINLGGLGARTRRGCGSLFCPEFSPVSAADVVDSFSRAESSYRLSYGRKGWATLSRRPLVRLVSPDPGDPPVQRPFEVWNRITRLLRYFRQGEDFARTRGKPPGRSRYPEPETVRKETGCRLVYSRSRPNGHPRCPSIPDDAFPRAELGLPIVFHFKDSNERAENPADYDPLDTTLYPVVGEKRLTRMSTPVIVKPLALGPNEAVPVIVFLHVDDRLSGVELVSNRTQATIARFPLTSIRDSRLSKYRNPQSPLANSPTGSALEAFLSMVQEEGFQ